MPTFSLTDFLSTLAEAHLFEALPEAPLTPEMRARLVETERDELGEAHFYSVVSQDLQRYAHLRRNLTCDLAIINRSIDHREARERLALHRQRIIHTDTANAVFREVMRQLDASTVEGDTIEAHLIRHLKGMKDPIRWLIAVNTHLYDDNHAYALQLMLSDLLVSPEAEDTREQVRAIQRSLPPEIERARRQRAEKITTELNKELAIIPFTPERQARIRLLLTLYKKTFGKLPVLAFAEQTAACLCCTYPLSLANRRHVILKWMELSDYTCPESDAINEAWINWREADNPFGSHPYHVLPMESLALVAHNLLDESWWLHTLPLPESTSAPFLAWFEHIKRPRREAEGLVHVMLGMISQEGRRGLSTEYLLHLEAFFKHVDPYYQKIRVTLEAADEALLERWKDATTLTDVIVTPEEQRAFLSPDSALIDAKDYSLAVKARMIREVNASLTRLATLPLSDQQAAIRAWLIARHFMDYLPPKGVVLSLKALTKIIQETLEASFDHLMRLRHEHRHLAAWGGGGDVIELKDEMTLCLADAKRYAGSPSLWSPLVQKGRLGEVTELLPQLMLKYGSAPSLVDVECIAENAFQLFIVFVLTHGTVRQCEDLLSRMKIEELTGIPLTYHATHRCYYPRTFPPIDLRELEEKAQATLLQYYRRASAYWLQMHLQAKKLITFIHAIQGCRDLASVLERVNAFELTECRQAFRRFNEAKRALQTKPESLITILSSDSLLTGNDAQRRLLRYHEACCRYVASYTIDIHKMTEVLYRMLPEGIYAITDSGSLIIPHSDARLPDLINFLQEYLENPSAQLALKTLRSPVNAFYEALAREDTGLSTRQGVLRFADSCARLGAATEEELITIHLLTQFFALRGVYHEAFREGLRNERWYREWVAYVDNMPQVERISEENPLKPLAKSLVFFTELKKPPAEIRQWFVKNIEKFWGVPDRGEITLRLSHGERALLKTLASPALYTRVNHWHHQRAHQWSVMISNVFHALREGTLHWYEGERLFPGELEEYPAIIPLDDLHEKVTLLTETDTLRSISAVQSHLMPAIQRWVAHYPGDENYPLALIIMFNPTFDLIAEHDAERPLTTLAKKRFTELMRKGALPWALQAAHSPESPYQLAMRQHDELLLATARSDRDFVEYIQRTIDDRLPTYERLDKTQQHQWRHVIEHVGEEAQFRLLLNQILRPLLSLSDFPESLLAIIWRLIHEVDRNMILQFLQPWLASGLEAVHGGHLYQYLGPLILRYGTTQEKAQWRSFQACYALSTIQPKITTNTLTAEDIAAWAPYERITEESELVMRLRAWREKDRLPYDTPRGIYHVRWQPGNALFAEMLLPQYSDLIEKSQRTAWLVDSLFCPELEADYHRIDPVAHEDHCRSLAHFLERTTTLDALLELIDKDHVDEVIEAAHVFVQYNHFGTVFSLTLRNFVKELAALFNEAFDSEEDPTTEDTRRTLSDLKCAVEGLKSTAKARGFYVIDGLATAVKQLQETPDDRLEESYESLKEHYRHVILFLKINRQYAPYSRSILENVHRELLIFFRHRIRIGRRDIGEAYFSLMFMNNIDIKDHEEAHIRLPEIPDADFTMIERQLSRCYEVINQWVRLTSRAEDNDIETLFVEHCITQARMNAEVLANLVRWMDRHRLLSLRNLVDDRFMARARGTLIEPYLLLIKEAVQWLHYDFSDTHHKSLNQIIVERWNEILIRQGITTERQLVLVLEAKRAIALLADDVDEAINVIERTIDSFPFSEAQTGMMNRLFQRFVDTFSRMMVNALEQADEALNDVSMEAVVDYIPKIKQWIDYLTNHERLLDLLRRYADLEYLTRVFIKPLGYLSALIREGMYFELNVSIHRSHEHEEVHAFQPFQPSFIRLAPSGPLLRKLLPLPPEVSFTSLTSRVQYGYQILYLWMNDDKKREYREIIQEFLENLQAFFRDIIHLRSFALTRFTASDFRALKSLREECWRIDDRSNEKLFRKIQALNDNDNKDNIFYYKKEKFASAEAMIIQHVLTQNRLRELSDKVALFTEERINERFKTVHDQIMRILIEGNSLERANLWEWMIQIERETLVESEGDYLTPREFMDIKKREVNDIVNRCFIDNIETKELVISQLFSDSVSNRRSGKFIIKKLISEDEKMIIDTVVMDIIPRYQLVLKLRDVCLIHADQRLVNLRKSHYNAIFQSSEMLQSFYEICEPRGKLKARWDQLKAQLAEINERLSALSEGIDYERMLREKIAIESAMDHAVTSDLKRQSDYLRDSLRFIYRQGTEEEKTELNEKLQQFINQLEESIEIQVNHYLAEEEKADGSAHCKAVVKQAREMVARRLSSSEESIDEAMQSFYEKIEILRQLKIYGVELLAMTELFHPENGRYKELPRSELMKGFFGFYRIQPESPESTAESTLSSVSSVRFFSMSSPTFSSSSNSSREDRSRIISCKGRF